MLEQNKHIARQFIAAFAAADTRTLERIVAEHMVDHNLAPGQKQGRQGVLEAVEMFRAAFPDLKITIESLVADEERVSVTGKMSGTNQGTLMGAPPTGKTATFAYMDHVCDCARPDRRGVARRRSGRHDASVGAAALLDSRPSVLRG